MQKKIALKLALINITELDEIRRMKITFQFPIEFLTLIVCSTIGAFANGLGTLLILLNVLGLLHFMKGGCHLGSE